MKSSFGTSLLILGLAVGLGLSGCSKNDEKAADGTERVKLKELRGLSARVPTKTRISKNAVGIGVMLKGETVSMTVGPEVDIDAKTLEDAKKNAASYKPKSLSGEELSDGYILTYESADDSGTIYWLVGRRVIDGSAYTCGVRSTKKEHQQTAITICKSLRS